MKVASCGPSLRGAGRARDCCRALRAGDHVRRVTVKPEFGARAAYTEVFSAKARHSLLPVHTTEPSGHASLILPGLMQATTYWAKAPGRGGFSKGISRLFLRDCVKKARIWATSVGDVRFAVCQRERMRPLQVTGDGARRGRRPINARIEVQTPLASTRSGLHRPAGGSVSAPGTASAPRGTQARRD